MLLTGAATPESCDATPPIGQSAAAVDCASVSGGAICKWLGIMQYPTYVLFSGGLDMVHYEEHHWTDDGDGSELAEQQLQWMRNRLWELQPPTYLPERSISYFLSSAVDSNIEEIERHPLTLSFTGGMYVFIFCLPPSPRLPKISAAETSVLFLVSSHRV